MTVETTSRIAGPFTGTGANATLAFGFKCLDATEILVTRDGAPLTLTADYSVSLNADQQSAPGGSVTILAAANTAGAEVIVQGNTSVRQATSLPSQSNWSPKVIEQALDRLTMMIQEARLALTAGDSALRLDLAGSTGSTFVNDVASGPGAVPRTVKAKVNDWIAAESYGIVGDGSDCTDKINALAPYAATNRRRIVMPKGVVHGALTLPAGTHLVGAGSRSDLVCLAGNYSTLTLGGSYITIEGLYWDETAKTGGYLVEIATGAGLSFEVIKLRDLASLNSRGGLKDSGTGTYVQFDAKDVKFRALRGRGVNTTRGSGFLYYTEVSADYVNVSDSDYTGFYLDMTGLGPSAGGLYMTDCNVSASADLYPNLNQVAFDVRNASTVEITRCLADGVAGDGFRVTNVDKLGMTQASGANVGGHVIVLDTVTNSDLIGVDSYGRNALSWNQASKNALRLVGGCAHLRILGGEGRSVTGNAIESVADQAGTVNIVGYHANANGGRAIKTPSGTHCIDWTAGEISGNTAGQYDLGSTAHTIAGVIGNSGAKLNAAGVATG